MNREKLLQEEAMLASRLRNELLRNAQNLVQMPKTAEMGEMEVVSHGSKTTKENISPIFSMSEDEILAFVEEFEVRELATLSVAELNHIGKVLGVDPKILVEGTD